LVLVLHQARLVFAGGYPKLVQYVETEAPSTTTATTGPTLLSSLSAVPRRQASNLNTPSTPMLATVRLSKAALRVVLATLVTEQEGGEDEKDGQDNHNSKNHDKKKEEDKDEAKPVN
jgi:hypothetical protein